MLPKTPISKSKTEEVLYTIGKLAKKASEKSGFRCTPTMIYNYERLGLMTAPKKTEGGTRLYNGYDLDQLTLIKRLQKEFGGSLDEVNNALKSVDDPGKLQQDKKVLRQFILEQKKNLGLTNKRFVESKEARKRGMIHAALELFEKKGYHRTTIADITSTSGTSHGTFYLYFKNKNALIREIVETVMEATRTAVAESASKGNTSKERISSMVDSVFQIDQRYQRMSHIFVQGAARNAGTYDKKVEKVYQKVAAPFTKEIEQGIRKGEFSCKDPKGAAFEIISLVELFRYRAIFKERFVFEKFGPDLEGFQRGRQMDLLNTLIDEILNPNSLATSSRKQGSKRNG